MIGTVLLLAGRALAALPPPDYRDELGERFAAEVSALTKRGRYDEAVERGEQIVDQVEPLVPVLYEIAFAHRLAGEDRAAMRAYDRCIEADPDHAAAHYDRGELRLLKGDIEGATEDFEAAARQSPDHWAAHFRLAHIAGRNHDPAAFEEHLVEALRHGFDFRTIVDDAEWKGWCRDPDLGPVLARLITVYSDESLLEQLRAE